MTSNKRTSKVKNGILIVVAIAFLIAIIGGTYSRYSSSGTANATGEIAKWHIVLGTENISSQSKTLTIPVQDVGNNGNVAEGKLAPGKTVVAEFVVDPTGSEVAVDYLMNVDLSNISGFDNSELEISNLKYTIEGTNTEEDMLIDPTAGNYLLEESLADVLDGKNVTFRIYITWTQSTDLARSLADAEKGATIENILIPVSVTARQHIQDGEISSDAQKTVIGTAEEILTVDTINQITPYVEYNGNTYRVLYNNEQGVELVSDDLVGSVTLGSNDPAELANTTEGQEYVARNNITLVGTTSTETPSSNTQYFNRSVWSYNNAIATLNYEAEKYRVPGDGIVDSARCVGSDPNNKFNKSTTTYSSSETWFAPYNNKYEQAEEVENQNSPQITGTPNYISDKEQLVALNIWNINKSYWLASRMMSIKPGDYGSYTYFGMRMASSISNNTTYTYLSLTFSGNNSRGDGGSGRISPCITSRIWSKSIGRQFT